MLGHLNVSAGNAIVSIITFAPESTAKLAVHRAGVGWDEDAAVLLEEPWTASTIAVAIDPRGNAFAALHSDLVYRRYVAGSGWSAASPMGLRSEVNYRWAVSAPDGSVVLATTDVDDEDLPRAPVVVRFE
jgi:hypothetical protein